MLRLSILISLAVAFTNIYAFADPTDDEMPTEISERYWESPGPEQDSPDAPRLLIMYPTREMTTLPNAQEKTRYAGRVEPANAKVKLDGSSVKILPGGVFTGLLNIKVGERTVTFTAEHAGAKTVVTRRVKREALVKGPAAWPLKFHPTRPVAPAGKQELWLREGSSFSVKLFASPGHEAFWRIGDAGEWHLMDSVSATPAEGGAYAGEIYADDTLSTGQLETIHFKIEGSRNDAGEVQSKTMKSDLRVRRLGEKETPTGKTIADFATFLMEEEGWKRYGNWIAGTPFPVIERRGERSYVDFGIGEAGYVESLAVEYESETVSPTLVRLPAPTLHEISPFRVALEWRTSSPVASVFAVGDEDSSKLEVRLLGAEQIEVSPLALSKTSAFRSVVLRDREADQPPRVECEFAEGQLWGYGWSITQADTLRLDVRLRPTALPQVTNKKPLGGLKIMIDAGHGGSDMGALGPSGLAEADVNLVLSALLGRKLTSLGATIRQCRRDDSKVELDDRVRDALDFDPDCFISVHHNSVAMSANPLSDRGPKVFYHYPHSIPLAEAVEEELVAALTPGESPRVLKEVFRVNRNLSDCPSILIEGGFVCNPEDEVLLRKTETLKKMADAIARGVTKLFE